MIKVIDDFLSAEDHKNLHDNMMGSYQPWVWNQSHMYDDLTYKMESLPDRENQVDYPQFVWGVYMDDNIVDPVVYKLMKPILNKISYSKLLRVKCNLNFPHPRCDETKYGYSHTDNPYKDAYTAIYYVNDCDGDTIFLDGDKKENRIPPKANRFVMFPSSVFHCGNTPKKTDRRVVINVNWIPL
jgi:hypothetical protein